MEVIPINYKTFNFNNVNISRDKILYNNEELYFSTPTLKIADIIDIDSRTYLQLKLTKKTQCNLFINNILATEAVVQSKVNDNNLYLNSQIIRDMMDNIYLKVKISELLNNIFDKRQIPVPYNSLKNGQQVKCIIKMTNFYKDSTICKFGYSFELYQLMILD
jgi:hypothetical protein